MISPAIAIIGAGPAGCYAADQLSRKLADARIDVFDRLPTPYGLVRGGVAPDHQGTKNIVRQFERTFQRPNVRFLGHVEIGRDLEFAELAAAYDATVVATGALEDRPLGIPGEQLPGVVGSGRFVSWYNGIPGAEDLSPLLDARSVAVVGNGNVALDIVRLMGKGRGDLLASDMARPALEAI
ncbi:MAG: FAD-dependent oxidoreductase, partial [Rhodocyclaceae bacterium]|nr:FAD-dependent oxidoreductase [Rhodocyclaceae bacterium]